MLDLFIVFFYLTSCKEMVKFPPKTDPDYDHWVMAMPNARNNLTAKSKIYICAMHFEGEWKSIKGGTRPVNPPSIFPGVSKSCFKQVLSKPRITAATALHREMKQKEVKVEMDKIKSFENFVKNIHSHVSKHFQFKRHDKDFTISTTDNLGRKVTKFLHFREVDSSFGFLQLICAEKDGIEVPFTLFDIQKKTYNP